jgi:hypothetical protein
VIGTVSSEAKARVARDYGCEFPIVAPDHRFAETVQSRFGGADVVIDGIGDAAREENFAALARRGPLDQPRPGQRRAAAASADRLVEKSITFSRPVVFDYTASPPTWRRAPAGSGRRWPTARFRRRRSSAMPWAPPTRRIAGSNRGARSARWC